MDIARSWAVGLALSGTMAGAYLVLPFLRSVTELLLLWPLLPAVVAASTQPAPARPHGLRHLVASLPPAVALPAAAVWSADKSGLGAVVDEPNRSTELGLIAVTALVGVIILDRARRGLASVSG